MYDKVHITKKPDYGNKLCEYSLGPEVATLFGREIGQSNGDVLLTGDEPARIKVG